MNHFLLLSWAGTLTKNMLALQATLMGLADGAGAVPGSSRPSGCFDARKSIIPKLCPDFPLSTENTDTNRLKFKYRLWPYPSRWLELVFPWPPWLSGEIGVCVLFSSLAWTRLHGRLIPAPCVV